MSIQFFERAVTNNTLDGFAGTIIGLLADAGFANVSYTETSGMLNFTSSDGIYGCTAFSTNINNTNFLNGTTKLLAVKDDSQKALIVYSNITRSNTLSNYDEWFYNFIIVDGVTSASTNNPLSTMTNMTGGTFKNVDDMTEIFLTPFIDSDTKILKPFYISANRVNHVIKTVVSDSNGNSFTSLGNLFYIKNA